MQVQVSFNGRSPLRLNSSGPQTVQVQTGVQSHSSDLESVVSLGETIVWILGLLLRDGEVFLAPGTMVESIEQR